MNELKIMCPEAHIDELSDALDALEALSISVEDADCLLYTSDAADDLLCVDLGGSRIIKKKKKI